ncbi:Vacuolar protein-sorting-associated protein 60 [Malassezia yamatoensis]|uniref:Vacuolar protein-sorting-associated protein 60 n=1 Tax=Malassezia yamatoensis TaxID=253288 RepID=A0AAJ5YWE8_9BASI|nr:Vacuolar protein-sorting-associated protein 60 [Malassezia yamatoensis]
MYRLFGQSQSKSKPDLQQAISNTEARAEATQVKISRLDAELGRYRDQMRKMRQGPGKSAVQQRAMRVLKQKRMYEAQIEQLMQQSYNMEQSIMTTENLRNTMTTVDAMQQANKEMRKTYGKLDVDKMEQIQDDMEDLLEQSSAIQETMSRSYGVPDDIDETELEAELEALYVLPLLTRSEEEPDEQQLDIPSYLQHATSAPSAIDFVDELPTESPTQEPEGKMRAA